MQIEIYKKGPKKSCLVLLYSQPASASLYPFVQAVLLQLSMELPHEPSTIRPTLLVSLVLLLLLSSELGNTFSTIFFEVRGVRLHLSQTSCAVFFEFLCISVGSTVGLVTIRLPVARSLPTRLEIPRSTVIRIVAVVSRTTVRFWSRRTRR